MLRRVTSFSDHSTKFRRLSDRLVRCDLGQAHDEGRHRTGAAPKLGAGFSPKQHKHKIRLRWMNMDLKFAPFSSEIELGFYAALFSSKIDTDQLNDAARPVVGLYEPQCHSDKSTRLQIHGNALTSQQSPLGLSRAEGIIKNLNTLEEFKSTDKTVMLKNRARQIWDAVQDGTIYSVPSLLASFAILSYADLKKYRFYYWFAFPALHSCPQWKQTDAIGHLTAQESTSLVDDVGTWRYTVDSREHGFFLLKKRRLGLGGSKDKNKDTGTGFTWLVGSLKDFESGFFNDVDESDRYVAFVDPSNYADNPSWPLRNLLVLIRHRYRLNKVQILCYRDTHARRHEARSIVLRLAMVDTDAVDKMDTAGAETEMPKVTGWERNANGELKARVANLAEYMDPTALADQAVDLNLKLIKWRIAPHLNLDVIKNTKCLLLGAGTLGSYVSRNLMGWGVRKITFVDHGSVSFSNPVRQPLFTFADCLNGGKAKALQAAEALKAIYPGVEAEGHVLSVPMLGHGVLDEAKMRAEFAKLQELVHAHDAVFLLMDSRESRWLPTVMGKWSAKVVINAALGFDTYVVMRHGPVPLLGEARERKEEEARTGAMGCYFCNDVVIAGNSMKDQTLDQQCTVTRPGVAAMASALAVELLVSILQHPQGQHAPAAVGDAPASEDHPLGIVPHQIRGFLDTFQTKVLHGRAYRHCSACSEPMLAAYGRDPWGFVREALNDGDYVAELSGLAEVQRQAMEADVVDWDDEGVADDGEAVLVE